MTASGLSRVSVVFCRESYTWDLNYAACSVLMVIAGGDLMLQIWGGCVCKHLADDAWLANAAALQEEKEGESGESRHSSSYYDESSVRPTD